MQDLNERPLVIIWEVTQACDLACAHCRASSQTRRHPMELSTGEGRHLIDQVAALEAPVFVFTGGDPLKRPDVFELFEYAVSKGIRPSFTPSATPLLTREAILKLKQSGLFRLAVSLDGSTAQIHDAFRGVAGSYDRTLQAIGWAREARLPVQINTSLTRRNVEDFDRLADLMEKLGVVFWSVFFLVPTGRGRREDLASGEEFEEIFRKLHAISKRARFGIKTTEAPHYRRYVLQHLGPNEVRGFHGINDAKGFVFISHVGEVYPSGFLPVSAGNVRREALAEIYRHSPLFLALRDSSQLKGKCGECEFRDVCGGSRARAFALTGDVFAEEPCCVYQPAGAMARRNSNFAAADA